jgi:hypothetical protein
MLRGGGSWGVLSKAYSSPPQSTEQILHPEKFLPPVDKPIEVDCGSFDEFPLGRTNVDYTDVLGELGVGSLIRRYLGESESKRASEGWGGDRYFLLRGRRGPMLLFVTAWDEGKDAREFYEAYSRVVPVKFPDAVPLGSRQSGARKWRYDGGYGYMQLKGRGVIILERAQSPEDLEQVVGFVVNNCAIH